VRQQVAQGPDVREDQGVDGKGITRAARHGAGGERGGERRQEPRRRVPRGGRVPPARIANGGIARRRGRAPGGGVDLRRRDLRPRRTPRPREAHRAREEAATTHAAARFRMNSEKRRTPTAVGPLGWWGPSFSV